MTAARVPRTECDVAIIRQHTQVEAWIDSDNSLLCMQIIGDHSVVVLGLTATGAEMLAANIAAGLRELSSRQAAAGGR